MRCSVLIPSHARPDKLRACLACLADQTLPARDYEVLVAIDGGPAPDNLVGAWPVSRAERLRVVPCPKVGQAALRNTLLALASGDTLLFLNDDMRPEPGLLEAHLRAQARAPSLVIGAAPWVVHHPDRLFDRLVRETSMIFFYDQMDRKLASGEASPDHDWGFRHAWMLNLSAPARLVRDAGGIGVFPCTYGYEDDELAFRIQRLTRVPVRYAPDARAHHDHRMDPGDYLARERRLGFAAWGFAHAAPECALAMFGRDVTSPDHLAACRTLLEFDRPLADRIRPVFAELAELPGDAIPGPAHPATDTLLHAIYQQHIPLKRWEFRRGLLDAALQAGAPGALG